MPRRKLMPDVIQAQDLITFSPTTLVRAAVRKMTDRRIGAVMVTEDGALKGIFTERDLIVRVVAQGRDPDTTTLAEVMTANPDTLPPDALAFAAFELMLSRSYRHLPVVDNGKIVGIVSIRDLFTVVKAQLEQDLKEREEFIFGSSYSVGAGA